MNDDLRQFLQYVRAKVTYLVGSSLIGMVAIQALATLQHQGDLPPHKYLAPTVVGLLLGTFAGLLALFFSERVQRQKAHLREVQKLLEQLRKSEERFSLAMRGTNDGVWDWDVKQNSLYFSPRWLGMLGFSPDDYPGNPDTWSALIDPQDKDRVLKLLDDCISGTAENFTTEYRMRHRDGSFIDILSRAYVVRENGSAIRIVGTHVDITERKRDAEIHQSNARRFREALRVAQMAGWEASDPGSIHWSPEAYELFKISPGQLGSSVEDFYRLVHPDDLNEVKSAFGEAWATGSHYHCVQRIVLADGSVRVMRESAEPELDDAGNTVGMSGIVQDITEQAMMEAQLQQALKMEAVGQLTGGLAHDFNNLLTVIQGNAELLTLQSAQPCPEAASITQACERGAQLTHRLLTFSRQKALNPEPVNVYSLVTSMSDLFRRTLGESIRVSIPDRDCSQSTLVDPGQLENALLNLMINARDAMPLGGNITISCGSETLEATVLAGGAELAAGDYVTLSVTDEGTGMSEEVIRRAFEPFFTTKDVGKGTGLGLAMVFGFARQSGGGVMIKSKEGVGTTVTLYLPRSGSEACGSKTPVIESATAGQQELILVIEDDTQVKTLTEMMLKTLGYQVVCAEDTATAQRMIDSHPEFDLILSDVVLPGGTSGPEFIENLKRTRPSVTALFMSGYTARASSGKGLLDSGEALLNKPFKLEELASAVSAALQRGRTRGRAAANEASVG